MLKIIFYAILAMQTFILFVFNLVAYNNEECHTGINTYFVGIVELLLFVFIIRLYLKLKKSNYIIPILSMVIVILSFAEAFYFEKNNVLMKYEIWIEKGKPKKFGSSVSNDHVLDYQVLYIKCDRTKQAT